MGNYITNDKKLASWIKNRNHGMKNRDEIDFCECKNTTITSHSKSIELRKLKNIGKRNLMPNT